VRTIRLTKGYEATVDDADYEELNKLNWYWEHGYARTDAWVLGVRYRIYMHSLLLPAAKLVDHVNGDGLDNRRENLRPATEQQNCFNSRGYAKSGYKGVYTDNGQKWYVKISRDRKTFTKGGFDSPEDAARFYNKKATELHGDFAYLNEVAA